MTGARVKLGGENLLMDTMHGLFRVVLVVTSLLSGSICPANVRAQSESTPVDPNAKSREVNSVVARLDDADPFATASALEAAAKLGEEIKAMIATIDASRQKSLDLRKDFSAKVTAQANNRTAVAFYEREIAKLDEGIRKLNGVRDSLAKAAAELSEKAEKARTNPDVKVILEAEAAKARANKATEDLRKLTPKVLKP